MVSKKPSFFAAAFFFKIMANEKKYTLPDSTTIEVVAIKKMSLKQFNEIKESLQKKGWTAKAYQTGFYQNIKQDAST